MAALVTSTIGLDISVYDQLVGPLKAARGFPGLRVGLSNAPAVRPV
jgi:hypothetical protein